MIFKWALKNVGFSMCVSIDVFVSIDVYYYSPLTETTRNLFNIII